MTLRSIVAALGGDLYAGGRRANVPAPGHSAHDRSVSLMLSGDRVIAHGFGGVDWKAALDDLRQRGLIDADGRLFAGARSAAGPAPVTAAVREAAVQDLWAAARPVRAGSPAALHARRRAIGRSLSSVAPLRQHLAAPLSVYRPGRATRPALLAAVTAADGALTALEIVYLAPNGALASGVILPRKTVGRLPPGCAVRLDPAASRLLVAEGVFTALSAGARFGLPAWALLSTTNLRRWFAPAGVREVLIAADRGADGEASAERLARRLRSDGRIVSIRLPPLPHGDWNEAASPQDREEKKGRARAPEAGGMSPLAGRRPPDDRPRD